MSIHPTALVDSTAVVHESAEIGPFAILEANVRIGAGTRVGPYVHIHANVSIGENNVFHSHCVIGDAPQHLAYKGEPRGTVIGNGNVFREHATVHRSFQEEHPTTIGDDCLFMVNSHVGHDSVVGNRVILTNGSLLGGHVEIQDFAIISGNSTIHQFVRIGRFVMMQGLSGSSKDVPPFCMAADKNEVVGLNVVGLRRAGFNTAARNEIKRAFHVLYREGHSVPRALELLRAGNPGPEVKEMITFIEGSKKGICKFRNAEDVVEE
jgi:UDP-N-acetylglucosamine acyltransferase